MSRNYKFRSLQVITDNTGNVVAEYAYSAWGARELISGNNDITNRGYTGHEHLESLGLINMNGRVYDPVLARFLSPDPYVQAPDLRRVLTGMRTAGIIHLSITTQMGNLWQLIFLSTYANFGLK